jgi:hypothetical protein
MSSEKPKTVWTPCSSCDRDTHHDILFSAQESEYEYRLERYYQVVSCRGCETTSFRKIVSHIEDAYQTDEHEWVVPKDISLYPAVLKGHRAVPDTARAPRLVRDIYEQSIQATLRRALVCTRVRGADWRRLCGRSTCIAGQSRPTGTHRRAGEICGWGARRAGNAAKRNATPLKCQRLAWRSRVIA